jgi:hypothetical protein
MYALLIPVMLAVFDSSTKFPESVLMGQSVFLGNFDECIEVEHVPTAIGPFSGQHCLAEFQGLPASMQTHSSRNMPNIEGVGRKVRNMGGNGRAVSAFSEYTQRQTNSFSYVT